MMHGDGERVMICGASGSGKSTLGDAITMGAQRLILFDYTSTRRSKVAKQRLVEVSSLADLRDAVIDGYSSGFRIWFRPQPERQAQIEAGHKMANFLRILQNHQYEKGRAIPNIAVSVDEMSDVFPVAPLPANLRGMEWLSKAGRHFRLDFIGASQRPAQVSTEFRGNAEKKYWLRLDSGPDVDAVNAASGTKVRDLVKTLPNHRFIRVEQGQISTGATKPL